MLYSFFSLVSVSCTHNFLTYVPNTYQISTHCKLVLDQKQYWWPKRSGFVSKIKCNEIFTNLWGFLKEGPLKRVFSWYFRSFSWKRRDRYSFQLVFFDDIHVLLFSWCCRKGQEISEGNCAIPSIIPKDSETVALSRKIREKLYVSNINIPNHYLQQKIWISCLLF